MLRPSCTATTRPPQRFTAAEIASLEPPGASRTIRRLRPGELGPALHPAGCAPASTVATPVPAVPPRKDASATIPAATTTDRPGWRPLLADCCRPGCIIRAPT